MNILGGYLNMYSDYSTCQITIGMPYLFGGTWVDGNSLSDMANSEPGRVFRQQPVRNPHVGLQSRHPATRPI